MTSVPPHQQQEDERIKIYKIIKLNISQFAYNLSPFVYLMFYIYQTSGSALKETYQVLLQNYLLG